MIVDVYLYFLRFVVIFLEFLSFLCSVLRVPHKTDPSHRDRSVSVPAESATETATVNHFGCLNRAISSFARGQKNASLYSN